MGPGKIFLLQEDYKKKPPLSCLWTPICGMQLYNHFVTTRGMSFRKKLLKVEVEDGSSVKSWNSYYPMPETNAPCLRPLL
jgi:hypothetical protein